MESETLHRQRESLFRMELRKLITTLSPSQRIICNDDWQHNFASALVLFFRFSFIE